MKKKTIDVKLEYERRKQRWVNRYVMIAYITVLITNETVVLFIKESGAMLSTVGL